MPDTGDPRDRGLYQILKIATQVRRAEIINQLAASHGLAVATGPFAGMALLPEVCWNDGDLPPKILGCYEAELHPAVAKAIARKPIAIVNIGCAEGYYAVGMARALTQARIFAFETDARGQSICARAAAANQVGDRVSVQGACGIETLRQLLPQLERPLLIVDCEGAELSLLDPSQLPEIKRCDMIVECHDFLNPQITATLRQRFAGSHDVEDIGEGPRDPNMFPSLRRWESSDRWLAVNENRPVMMNWLVCWSR